VVPEVTIGTLLASNYVQGCPHCGSIILALENCLWVSGSVPAVQNVLNGERRLLPTERRSFDESEKEWALVLGNHLTGGLTAWRRGESSESWPLDPPVKCECQRPLRGERDISLLDFLVDAIYSASPLNRHARHGMSRGINVSVVRAPTSTARRRRGRIETPGGRVAIVASHD
jgi:hypothetical protein